MEKTIQKSLMTDVYRYHTGDSPRARYMRNGLIKKFGSACSDIFILRSPGDLLVDVL